MNNLNNYLQGLQNKNFSPGTITTYRRIIGYYGQQSLTSQNIINFFKKIIKRLDPGTCRLYLAALISYGKYLRVEINWAEIIILIPRQTKKFYTTLNLEELIKLKETRFEKTQNNYERNNLILDFLFYSGLRASELVNVRHCDWQGNCLRILGKGNKVRYAFLPDFLAKYANNCQGYLFTDRQGQKLSTSWLRMMIRRRVKLAGINRLVSPHTFRRSLATNLYNRGGKLETIQKQLGHSNIQTTMGYIHNDFNTLYADYSKLWLGGIHA